MKLVLVAIHIQPSPRAVPLGCAMLAAELKRAFPHELQARILDLFVDQTAVVCAEKILESDPDLVGFSMYVWNRTLSLAIAAILKARRPDLVVFAGGPEATADQAGVLADPSMDFILPGEGEELIVQAMAPLLKGVPTQALLGSFKPVPVKDLAALSSPYLDGTLNLQEYSGALWELSRGCPFTCDFCFEARGSAGIRRISMARAEAELAAFEASGVREVFVLDPTFNYHKVQAKQILRLIANRAPNIHFFFEIRSEFIDPEMAELFAAVPCTLQIGMQSAQDEVLKNISRTIDPEDFEAKVLLLHQAGVPYGFDLIYGLPGDSLEGFCGSVDFAMSLVPNHLDIFRLSVLPGTRLAETAPGLGLEYQGLNPYAVIASPTFGRDDMARAEKIALGCDALYNRGKAVPWFGILIETLGIAPSAIFEAFANFLESRIADDLTQVQRDFFAALFHEQDEDRCGCLAADLISYFGYSAELMDAPGPELEGSDAPFRLVSFHHDPRELVDQLQAGTTNLEELALALDPSPCKARLCLHEGEVNLLLSGSS